MSEVMIQYVVKPDRVAQNLALLEAFLAELETVSPTDLSYQVYQLGDGTGFLHFVESLTGAQPFAHLESYRRYRDTVAERCSTPPVMQALMPVGGFQTGS